MRKISVSIIIATCNRESILWVSVEKAIASIENRSAEIIIVNDGDQPLVGVPSSSSKICCFNNPSKGVSSARNFGASIAKGNVLFFIDDDMWIVSEALDWIVKMMGCASNRDSVYNVNWQYPLELDQKLQSSKVGRFLLTANYNNMWGRMKAPGIQPSRGLYQCKNIASCSLVMHKNTFCKIGGYNENFIFQGEDMDLSTRINAQDIPIYATFDVTLFHNHQDRLEIAGFLARLKAGYQSEFKATAAGLLPNTDTFYTTGKQFLLNFIAATEPVWLIIYKSIPNSSIFKPISNKIIGMLAGLQKYKQWKASQ